VSGGKITFGSAFTGQVPVLLFLTQSINYAI